MILRTLGKNIFLNRATLHRLLRIRSERGFADADSECPVKLSLTCIEQTVPNWSFIQQNIP